MGGAGLQAHCTLDFVLAPYSYFDSSITPVGLTQCLLLLLIER